MASSSGIFGNLFTGKSGNQSQVLTLYHCTISLTCSAIQPVGDMDVEMGTPEKPIEMAHVWLPFMYSELEEEIEYRGNVMLKIQR